MISGYARGAQLAVIAALETQIVGYDTDVKRIAKHPDAQRLQTIPGIGIFGAALLLAEIGRSSAFTPSTSLPLTRAGSPGPGARATRPAMAG